MLATKLFDIMNSYHKMLLNKIRPKKNPLFPQSSCKKIGVFKNIFLFQRFFFFFNFERFFYLKDFFSSILKDFFYSFGKYGFFFSQIKIKVFCFAYFCIVGLLYFPTTFYLQGSIKQLSKTWNVLLEPFNIKSTLRNGPILRFHCQKKKKKSPTPY